MSAPAPNDGWLAIGEDVRIKRSESKKYIRFLISNLRISIVPNAAMKAHPTELLSVVSPATETGTITGPMPGRHGRLGAEDSPTDGQQERQGSPEKCCEVGEYTIGNSTKYREEKRLI